MEWWGGVLRGWAGGNACDLEEGWMRVFLWEGRRLKVKGRGFFSID